MHCISNSHKHTNTDLKIDQKIVYLCWGEVGAVASVHSRTVGDNTRYCQGITDLVSLATLQLQILGCDPCNRTYAKRCIRIFVILHRDS